ncbi:EAL domain-containing protein [Albimonas sp. CAU 1670]|uniref:putative bifunctional diguanylate cyclase/phosphodiesterase n=1 Tax=Albimonas sp. CAU 1670 TaxID=3032599 RepID=UPI0023DAF43D|nr:EAL domain-containing protein [Albimonas sp. CAU 1670]MDF2231963.1 EAL domain-containing protein [Albimonas sp. CAU 1670]
MLESGGSHHDPAMIAAALLVGAAGVALSVRFYLRACSESRERRRWWLVLTGITSGADIWAMQTLLSLGYIEGAPHGHDPTIVILSFVAAVAGGVALLQFAFGRRGLGAAILVGVGYGLLTAGVQISNIASVAAEGRTIWRPEMVAALLIWAAPVCALASAALRARRGARAPWQGAAIFIVCIAGMFGIGLNVAEFRHEAGVAIPQGMLDDLGVALLVVTLTAIVLVLGAAFVLIDRSAEQEARSRYRHMALHDPLTDLPNRACLRDELARAVEASRALNARLALAAIDLNRFKPINDVHGHAAGDALLRGVADALAAAMGPGEFVARAGGDEFVAFKTGLADREEAELFAQRIMAAVRTPVDWEGLSLSVGCGLGIAIFPHDADTPELLQSRADLALYRAKGEAGEAPRFYEQRMDEAGRARSALAMELREALERSEFELWFQPQALLADGRITGFEALLRWRRPGHGLVLPGDFVPVAEKTGLIRPIGAWVLREACRAAARWPQEYGVSVNASPAQLTQADFAEQVADALLAAGLAPDRLEIELTEASLIADHGRLLEVMVELKAAGVRVAMDDYGAGLASLGALRSFPFDRLKIDRGFIDAMDRDPAAAAMVEATLLQARALNMPVMAEGVEEAAHLDRLRRHGCEQAQGFYFGRPMPLEEARRLMERRQGGPAADRASAPAAN